MTITQHYPFPFPISLPLPRPRPRLDNTHTCLSDKLKTMAALALRSPALSLASIISPLTHHIRPSPIIQRIHTFHPFWQSFVIPIGATSGASSWLGDIWDSVLKAVPKKKTSHMKKRHRQMAGKALKDVTALNTCSSCGRTKRAHVLCPYCALGESMSFTNSV